MGISFTIRNSVGEGQSQTKSLNGLVSSALANGKSQLPLHMAVQPAKHDYEGRKVEGVKLYREEWVRMEDMHFTSHWDLTLTAWSCPGLYFSARSP
jgi:hypothetical protein